MVQRGVDQDSSVIPSRRLNSDGLVDQRTLTQALVGNSDRCVSRICFSEWIKIMSLQELTVFAKKSDAVAVYRPHCVLDRRRSKFRQYFLLLDIKQDNCCR